MIKPGRVVAKADVVILALLVAIDKGLDICLILISLSQAPDRKIMFSDSLNSPLAAR